MRLNYAPHAVDGLLIVWEHRPHPNAKDLGRCPVVQILAIVGSSPDGWDLPGSAWLLGISDWIGSGCWFTMHYQTNNPKRKLIKYHLINQLKMLKMSQKI